MWQQSDCRIQNATEDNPAGCLSDLYPFVATTYAGPQADAGGGTSMAFYNMQNGDAPLFKKLADEYTLSDNHHQPAQGGSGIQHIFLGTGDDIFWSDGNGNPTVPPVSQIANPNYSVPIPAGHIERIFEICHFLADEKAQFLSAYRRAHPHRAPGNSAETRWREIVLRVPDLRDRDKNKQLDELMKEMLQRVLRLMEGK